MTNTEIMNHWNWDAIEEETLTQVGYEIISDTIAELSEEDFSNAVNAFNAWVDGEITKKELNKTLKPMGLTPAMMNIWLTV